MEFEEYIRKSEMGRHSIQGDLGKFTNRPVSDCFLGVPPDDLYGRKALIELPEKVVGLHLCLGSDCEEVIRAFAASSIPQQLERFSIGDSSYALGKGRDYSKVSEILSGIEFPKLKIFEYGVWQLFSNAHTLLGCLGDVTGLLNRMPNLEGLSLSGCFELVGPLNFPRLKNFDVELADCVTGINGGFISQATLSHLLCSDYPALEDFFLDLDCEDNQYGYQFPEQFLEGTRLPVLHQLEITGGFLAGEKERLILSPLCSRATNQGHFEDMSVSSS